MPTCFHHVADFAPEQLRFPPAAGFSIRADFCGGEVSSDLGALLLAAVDRRIGLIERLVAAVSDSRHPSYITHSMRDLLTQRVFQIASGYEDGNDANALRRSDIYRMAHALVLQFIAGYGRAPASITLDLDHTDDATYG
jgi:hypothetical protein